MNINTSMTQVKNGCHSYRDRMSAKVVQVIVFTKQEDFWGWGVELAISQKEVRSKIIGTYRQDTHDDIHVQLPSLAPHINKWEQIVN